MKIWDNIFLIWTVVDIIDGEPIVAYSEFEFEWILNIDDEFNQLADDFKNIKTVKDLFNNNDEQWNT